MIERRWRTTVDLVGLLIVALVFNGVWLGSDLLDVLKEGTRLPLMLFAELFMVLGLAAAYAALAHAVNVTTIRMDARHIDVRHGPVPWPGRRRIDRGPVEGVFVHQKHHFGSSKHKPKVSYRVLAATRRDAADGEGVRVLNGLRHHRQAHYLAEAMADHLGVVTNAQVGR